MVGITFKNVNIIFLSAKHMYMYIHIKTLCIHTYIYVYIRSLESIYKNSEGGYGINTQVEKSKKMTTVNFMGYDLNKLF